VRYRQFHTVKGNTTGIKIADSSEYVRWFYLSSHDMRK